MENERDSSNLINFDKKSIDEIFIFNPDYQGQNLNNNANFLNWKESMLKIYGNNAKLFNCLKDNILYFSSDEECKSYPVYQSNCPKCNNKICFYCSRYMPDYYNENGTCCLRRKIKCIIYQDCYRYIKPISKEEYINTYMEAFISFIVPFISLLTYIEHIQDILCYKLIIKNRNNGKIERYYQHLKYYSFIEFINISFALLLIIPLFIIHTYFILFMLLISIPFKYIPLKYLLGIHYATLANSFSSSCSF